MGAALRYGPLGAVTALAITSALTVWNTARGSGPFVRASITHSLLASQLFVAVAALTSLVLAAVTSERSTSERAERELAAEQAALRRIATLVAGEAASKRVFDEVTARRAEATSAGSVQATAAADAQIYRETVGPNPGGDTTSIPESKKAVVKRSVRQKHRLKRRSPHQR